MAKFLPLGHGTSNTTQPSLNFEGYETPKTFVDWVLENGVTEPRMEVENFSEPAVQPVSDRRLLSDRYKAVHVWMNTHQRVRPIDVLVAVLLFVVIAMGTAQMLEPDPPTLPPLSEMR